MKITPEILTGRTRDHIEDARDLGCSVHREMVASLRKLRSLAAKEGFDLKVASGFRDYDSQLRIWNLKATGKRALLDAKGMPLNYTELTPKEIVYAILRWSALPGGSRHHWGTEIDVYDSAAMPSDYKVQLTPNEVESGGIFAPFHDWLDTVLTNHGFFRPYASDRGGVSPERWHLSYAPISVPYLSAFTLDILSETVAASTMELKVLVLKELPGIFQRFVTNVDRPAIDSSGAAGAMA